MSTVGQLKVNGNDVQIIDSQTGKDLLALVAVDSLKLSITPGHRRLLLDVSPWVFTYDVPADVMWMVQGMPVKAVIIGDDVVSQTVPVDEIVKEWRDAK